MKTARKDGLATRRRLLEAACRVFAEKGYRDATIGEICRLARANVAAVNYHFGGKDELYAEAWRSAFDEGLRVFPPDGGLARTAPVEQRFHAFIRSFLHRILGNGRLGHAGRLIVMELTQPTESLADVREAAIRPLHERSLALVTELVGPRASSERILFCEMSVIHQCLAIGFQRGRYSAFHRYVEVAAGDIDALADHITRFSLAGIASLRERAENQEGDS